MKNEKLKFFNKKILKKKTFKCILSFKVSSKSGNKKSFLTLQIDNTHFLCFKKTIALTYILFLLLQAYQLYYKGSTKKV